MSPPAIAQESSRSADDSESDDEVVVFHGRGARGASHSQALAKPATKHDSTSHSLIKAAISHPNECTPRLSKIELLPQEIKDLVLKHVRYEGLSGLSQTSRGLHLVVLPFLYQNIAISARRRAANDFSTTQTPDQLLLRTLTKRPQYRLYIQTLCFREMDQWVADPNPILAFCPKLKTLEIHFAIDQWHGRVDFIDASKLTEGLEHVKATLTHLNITYDLNSMNGEFCHPEVYGHCSLKPLSHLESASIPLCVLLGWDPGCAPSILHVLPPSLIKLNIEEDHWENDTHKWREKEVLRRFKEFVRDRTWIDATPNLKILNLRSIAKEDAARARHDDEESPYQGELEFKRLCAENSLTCNDFRIHARY